MRQKHPNAPRVSSRPTKLGDRSLGRAPEGGIRDKLRVDGARVTRRAIRAAGGRGRSRNSVRIITPPPTGRQHRTRRGSESAPQVFIHPPTPRRPAGSRGRTARAAARSGSGRTWKRYAAADAPADPVITVSPERRRRSEPREITMPAPTLASLLPLLLLCRLSLCQYSSDLCSWKGR